MQPRWVQVVEMAATLLPSRTTQMRRASNAMRDAGGNAASGPTETWPFVALATCERADAGAAVAVSA